MRPPYTLRHSQGAAAGKLKEAEARAEAAEKALKDAELHASVQVEKAEARAVEEMRVAQAASMAALKEAKAKAENAEEAARTAAETAAAVQVLDIPLLHESSDAIITTFVINEVCLAMDATHIACFKDSHAVTELDSSEAEGVRKQHGRA